MRPLLTFLTALAILGGARGVAAWAEGADTVPSWLSGLLPNPPPRQNSALEFDRLLHDFGNLLEGETFDTSFPFTNNGDVPVTIRKARHCGCLRLTYPKNVPIAPGERITLQVTMDSRQRTGLQVKPIELFTDEDGEGPQTGVMIKGTVVSPAVLRDRFVVWTGAEPNESTTRRLPFNLAEGSVNPTASCEAKLVESQIEGNELVLHLTAPGQPGAVSADVVLGCRITNGPWAGTDWTTTLPVRIEVPSPFQAMPSKLTLDRDKNARLLLRLERPDRDAITRVVAPDGVVCTEDDTRNDRLKRYNLGFAAGASPLPAGATLDIFTTLDDGTTPTLRVPLNDLR